MVLEPLTPEELARHQRGISKLRKQLFRLHSPVDCFIVPGSERIVPASAHSKWCADAGDYRLFYFGGLEYCVDSGDRDGHSQASVTHFREERCIFALTAARGHTVTAVTVPFGVLDELLYERIRSHRLSNLSPTYTGSQ